MLTVISKDGTQIAYEKIGSGPAIIVVAAAAADHNDATPLAQQLAQSFTVYNYDRRGRGNSTDNSSTYTVDREIEDIEALIHVIGETPSLFGSSAGAVLALEAADKLDNRIAKLALYEPPFIINDGRAPVPADYIQNLNKLVHDGNRSDAVEYFMTAAIGVPAEFLDYMKADPSWGNMEGMAHTLAYDGLIMGDTQSGKPLPTDRWHVHVPTLVMTGENSEPFIQSAAKALVELLPHGEYRALPGQDHSAVMMAPDVLAGAITEFIQP
ncbi:alpha/beta fold hydrolase [Paenibacillus mendelii]|uniref:Alpha/beta fold hydrolase n=1 Tax=Paenibacillus mendelii TaxID=206163 RepID=A0ABV6JHT8_9BACL|nr:alpha/beta hydrolase [Paenibacillus mendelii]MCQ6557262.1 alpha/beta hydrolase [Paenibacillus mendelii]